MKEYALYKGEELLSTGTIYEIAEEMNIKPETVRFYGTKTYRARLAMRKTVKDTRTLVCLDDDNERSNRSLMYFSDGKVYKSMSINLSRKLREKNNCATCKRRGNYEIGCEAFSAEPEDCWAYIMDND